FGPLQNKKQYINKLNALKRQQQQEPNSQHNKEWFVNTTNTDVPTNVEWLLSLGPKFALPTTRTTFPLFNVISEGEDCIQTLESKEQQEISRVNLITLINDYMRNNVLSKRDRLILDTLGKTNKFLKENKHILILNSDKGGKTVAMMKQDYESKMHKILMDMCTYRRLRKDPTMALQEKCNKLITKCLN
ncbi:uncharacterized protein, partial [Musca autumnalis]|uniref:uncharacterized protein n=1 Tax=Musca autumnalis TaxID=221902 RepID=UPI003CF7C9FD